MSYALACVRACVRACVLACVCTSVQARVRAYTRVYEHTGVYGHSGRCPLGAYTREYGNTAYCHACTNILECAQHARACSTAEAAVSEGERVGSEGSGEGEGSVNRTWISKGEVGIWPVCKAGMHGCMTCVAGILGWHTWLAYWAGILGWHTGQEQRRWSIRPGAAHVARIEVEGEHRQAADRPTAESCHRAEETSLSWQLRRRVCTRGGTQGAAVTSGNAPWVGREQLWRRRRRQQWRR